MTESGVFTSPETLEDPPDGIINAYGSLLKLDPEDSLFLGSHDYELYETRLTLGLVRPGDVAVDVGAMIGYYTMMLAKQATGTGRVYAFEPDPRNFELLTENIAMNRYEHVTARQALVGASSGTSKLFLAPEQYRGDNRAYAHDDREGVDVEMVALDDVITEPVDLVKIDVQGYEGHVLEGMKDLIARSDHLTMLLEYSPTLLDEAGTEPRAMLASLGALGFKLFEVDEEVHQIRAVGDAEALIARFVEGDAYNTDYTNLLCVKGPR